MKLVVGNLYEIPELLEKSAEGEFVVFKGSLLSQN